MSPQDGSVPEVGLTGARFGGASRRRTRRSAASAEAAQDPARDRPVSDATEARTEVMDVVAGEGGADPAPAASAGASDSAAMEPSAGAPVVAGPAADQAADQAADPAPPATAGDEPAGPVVGRTGARFGGPSRRRRSARPDGERPALSTEQTSGQPPEQPVVVGPPPLPGVDPGPPAGDFDPSSSSFVRPYVLTRGRTRSRFELSIEALVSAVPMATREPEDSEHQAVIALCREPRSVAEVAALLGVPLGVARVLLGDLAASGAVAVHRTAGAAGPDLALMERVLSGLRRL